jgi:SNF2 family DNA or RNA helicase
MWKKYPFKTKPYDHQVRALQMSFDKEYFAYFMEMGTGKTKVVLDNVGILHHNHKIEGALIIAPKSVYSIWAYDEIKTHYPFDDIDVYLWKTPNSIKERLRDVNFYKKDGTFKFLIMNVEALSGKKGATAALKFVNNFKALVAVDESSKIKNPQALRTKSILALKEKALYRRLLTGTPITNSPLDVYTQFEFLNKDVLGFTSYFSFRNRYCVFHESVQNGKIVKFPKYYTNLDELEKKIKVCSFRVTKEECLDLPDKIYQKRYCELSEEQQKVYDDLKERALALLEDSSVSFTHKLTEILRLHQVANGFVMNDDQSIIEFKTSEKMNLLMETLEEIQGKVIIWANYTHNIKQIEKALKIKYGDKSTVSFFGERNTQERIDARDSFQKDPEVRFFVGNPQTGGYGLTLTSAATMIYFNNNYNFEYREQSEARIHRIGQKLNCTYIDLICKDTIDEKVISILGNKIKLSAKILGEQARSWL